MKIVFDTNVLISAFLAHGHCAELLEHCVYHHDLYISEFIINEFSEKMLDTFDMPNKEVKEAARLLRYRFSIVEPIEFDKQVCRDPDDDAVLGTAVRVHADCIITGDKDLLDLKRFREIDIILPRDFWEMEKES
jgi:putative PIN family toxin of toxin-antitoxin system